MPKTLHDYSFTGSSSAGKKRSEFPSQREDAWIDTTPRKGRKLPPTTIVDDLQIQGDEISDSDEERLQFTPGPPINIDSSDDQDSTMITERPAMSLSDEEAEEDDDDILGRTRSDSDEDTSVQDELPSARGRLVRGKKASIPAAPSTDSLDLEIVKRTRPSAKALGKRRARTPVTETEEESVQPLASPAKRSRLRERSSSLPDAAAAATSSSRKLVKGGDRVTSFSLAVPSSTSTRTLKKPVIALTETDEDGEEASEDEMDAEAPRTNSSARKTRSATQRERQDRRKSQQALRTAPFVHHRRRSTDSDDDYDVTEDFDRIKRDLMPAVDLKRYRAAPFKDLKALNKADLDDGLSAAESGMDRAKGSGKSKRKKKRVQPKPLPPSPPDTKYYSDVDPHPLRELFNDNKVKTRSSIGGPRAISDSDSLSEANDSDASEQGVLEQESGSESEFASRGDSPIVEDIELDHEVVVDDRLRPKRIGKDRFAALKAARALKARRSQPTTVIADSEEDEKDIRSRVVDIDSSSEVEADDDTDGKATSDTSAAALEGFIDDDEDDEDKIREARAQIPLEFTSAQTESLGASIRTVLLALAYEVVDPGQDWMTRRAENEHARKRTRSRIEKALPSLVHSSAWTDSFNHDIATYPEFSSQSIAAEPGCDVCGNDNKTSTYEITLSGKLYDRDTYQRRRDPDKPSEITYRAGRFCFDRAHAYHQLKHWEINAYRQLKRHVGRVDNNLGLAARTQWAEQTMDKLNKPGSLFDILCRDVSSNFDNTLRNYVR